MQENWNFEPHQIVQGSQLNYHNLCIRVTAPRATNKGVDFVTLYAMVIISFTSCVFLIECVYFIMLPKIYKIRSLYPVTAQKLGYDLIFSH